MSDERKVAMDAIIRTLASERGELLRDVETQRIATLEWATAERRVAIEELRRELTGRSSPCVVSAPSSSMTCVASSIW